MTAAKVTESASAMQGGDNYDFAMPENYFGELLKSRRSTVFDPTIGGPYSQASLANAVGRIVGEKLSRSTVNNWETGETQLVKPRHINALARLGILTVTESVLAMGLELESVPVLEREERHLLALFRRLSPSLRDTALRLISALPPRPARSNPDRRSADPDHDQSVDRA